MTPVAAIVYSKNRAPQLELLLRSIQETNPEAFRTITVIFTYSYSGSRLYEQAYDKVREMYPGCIWTQEGEGRFETITKKVINLLGASNLITFLMDDMCFFDTFEPRLVDRALSFPDTLGFSLRLGRNISYCYTENELEVPPTETDTLEEGGVMSWTWREYNLSFGYPMSLDGHVFRGTDLIRWLSGIKFSDPNQLESILAMRAAASSPSPEWPVMLASFVNSVVTNFPINMVQTRFPDNRVGGNKESEPLEMTLRFLGNERIVRPEFTPATVSSTHMPIIPQWEKIV